MRRILLRIFTRLPTKYITSGLILIIILFIYGITGSYFIMRLNLVDSIYYSVITMATDPCACRSCPACLCIQYNPDKFPGKNE